MILKDNSPVLFGLVLAGGKSIRMGQDKALMNWHGGEQRYYMADLLQLFCANVFISCREEQLESIARNYQALPDTYTGLGPYGGILSAFSAYPEAAWLVTACDLPLLDKDTLQFLVQHRHPASVATTFESPFDDLPEPLVAIWEPKSHPLLLSYLSEGYSCPRKVLIKNIQEVTLLKAPDPNALLNANTPVDIKAVEAITGQKISV